MLLANPDWQSHCNVTGQEKALAVYTEVVVQKLLKASFTVVIFLVCACDNSGHFSLEFPAQISEIKGFDGTETGEITTRVDSLVKKVGTSFLVFPGEGNTGSTVRIQMVNEIPNTAETASSSHIDYASVFIPSGYRGVGGSKRIAGRATRYGNECLVEISRFVVEYTDELLQPVLWHELGHCAGLSHDSKPYEIMSAITYTLNYYDDEKIARFISQISAAIKKP